MSLDDTTPQGSRGQPRDARVGALVADRYRLLEQIGRGGMATVYRAEDQRSGELVALKELHYEGKRAEQVTSGFEHEFRVLAQLAHPRIVRVFDYGIDGERPYYTMELLEGESLKQRWPLPQRELCMLLRDVASSLALLHARRYVHRDVTPRNVWCERDGRAKLLDFGAMQPMGASSAVMGTPPFVAPEVLHRQPLDGRADIYALGALAYRALTRQHAYSARTLSELPREWLRGQPKVPTEDRFGEPIPPALGELVMAMISLDPSGRPSTATEVMERVCAVADLELDSDAATAQAYLLSPPLLGRDDALQRVRQDAQRAAMGRGRGLVLTGKSGMGHTRLLRELGREAAQLGLSVLVVDRGAVSGGDLGMLRELADEAVARLPASALEHARPLAGTLRELGGQLQQVLAAPDQKSAGQGAGGAELSEALHDWLCEAAADRPVMIAFDGVHECDALALGFIKRLVDSCPGRPLLVVCAIASDAAARMPRAAELLASYQDTIELRPLDEPEVQRLTEALFWGAEHRKAVGTWLHRVSGGAPRTCLALAQHMLDAGLARYEAGRWHLPAYPEQHGLPTDLQGVVESQVAKLSPLARDLAQAHALIHDDERPEHQPNLALTIQEQSQLLGVSVEDVHRTLAELHQAGVVYRVKGQDVIAHRALADHLRAQLGVERARALHRALSEVLMVRGNELFAAVRHQQLAGNDGAAVQLLLREGVTDDRRARMEEIRVALMGDCVTRAIDYARSQAMPRKTIDRLLELLMRVISVYDWSLAHYLDEELPHFSARLGDDASARDVGFFMAAVYVRALVAASAAERERLKECAQVLQSLAGYSRRADLNIDMCATYLAILEGREPAKSLESLAPRFYEMPDLSPFMQRAASGVQFHAAGVRLAARGNAAAGPIAQAFEQNIPGHWLGAHLSWLAAGFACDGATMKRFEPRVQVVAADDLWRRRTFLMYEARMHALHGNTLGLRAVIEDMEPIAAQFPGWRPWLELAHGRYHLMRGSLDEASTALESALAGADAGTHAAWPYAHPAWVALHAALDEPELAIELAREGLERCEALGLEAMCGFEHQLALADALTMTGAEEQAQRAIDDALALAKRFGLGGIHLGRIHEAEVALAICRGDIGAAKALLPKLGELYLPSEIPGLAARNVRLSQVVRRGGATNTSRLGRRAWETQVDD